MKHLLSISCLFIVFNAYSQFNLDSLWAVDNDLPYSINTVQSINFAFLQLRLDTISINVDSTLSFTYRGKSFSNIKDDMDGIKLRSIGGHGSRKTVLEFHSKNLREKLVLNRSYGHSVFYTEYLVQRNEENKAFFHRKNINEDIHVKGHYYASEDLFSYVGLNDGLEIPNEKCGLWKFIYPDEEVEIFVRECK